MGTHAGVAASARWGTACDALHWRALRQQLRRHRPEGRQRSCRPIWAFCSVSGFRDDVRAIDQKLKVTNATLVKVPFDLEHWTKVAAEQYPDGLPEPHSDDPTQWLFKGNVVGSEAPLHVAVARLLGYRWPDQEPDELDALADADGLVCLAVGGRRASGRRAPAGAARRGLRRRLVARRCSSASSPRPARQARRSRPGCATSSSPSTRSSSTTAPSSGTSGTAARTASASSATTTGSTGPSSRSSPTPSSATGSSASGPAGDEPGAEARLVGRARAPGASSQLILEGEAPYDIYVRWKPLAEQPLGWEPDLDDGVRLNIRPS